MTTGKKVKHCRTCGHAYTGRHCKNRACPRCAKGKAAARRAGRSRCARIRGGWTGWGTSFASSPATSGVATGLLPVNPSAAACAQEES